ncbi:maleylpyruvate isomerase N-terminal domain-containing protein [Actinocatenispora sera]|uniref:maleylpyruvate isomerase N-terminal domain-containing protein n=1 Tax=Actinocatenispora sera TaxID=390989 RepID=UPI0033D209B8
MESLDAAFLGAGRTALALIGRDEVRDRWDEPSALARMSVGMLACHLGRQLERTREILPLTGTGEPIDDAAEHYRRAAWVTATSLDDESMDRTTDERQAAAGYPAMIARCAAALAAAEALLVTGEAAAVVTIPWQGWSLRRADFLLTRLVEIVVHSDDLARSVDLPMPAFEPAAFAPVLHLLADLAAARHGQSALVSALTRAERRPDTITAF